MLFWTKTIEQTKYVIFIIVVAGVIIRLVSIPLFAPINPVDVYYVDNQSARLILDLKSPYLQEPIIDGYGYMFVYLPMVAIYYVPFYLLGDIRFGNIVADVIIMFSVYWIAKSLNRGAAFFAPLTYAVFPLSILLTSINGTNMMIGTSFLTFSIALLMKKKYLISAIFLGLAMATNQMVVFALPLLIYILWKEHKFSNFLYSVLLSAGIVLPFFITSPQDFIYNVFLFQFERSFQGNGTLSLYGLVNETVGLSLATWLRVAIFVAGVIIAMVWLRRKLTLFIPLLGGLLLFGAFILPVNGFLNYFLPGAAVVCALIPYAIDKIASYLEKSSSQ
jgi:4-amino-4-deoxy-L-arabinose transferase-like glycosyltransferase